VEFRTGPFLEDAELHGDGARRGGRAAGERVGGGGV
jgi:hypothetical protein